MNEGEGQGSRSENVVRGGFVWKSLRKLQRRKAGL